MAAGKGDSPRSRRPWSHLPTDLIEMISDHLIFIDLIRFGAVCTKWRSASLRSPNYHTIRFPWMLCLEHPSTQMLITSSPGDHKVPLIHLPITPPGMCLGSYNNWMVIGDGSSSSILLLNPLSGLQIPLPRKLRCRELTITIPWQYFDKVILTSAPTPHNLRCGTCVVVALKKDNPQFALCRPESVDEWILSPAARRRVMSLKDIIFHGGMLYGLTGYYEVVVFILHSLEVEVARVYHPDHPVIPLSLEDSIFGCMYLVGSVGKLFMAYKHYERQPPFSVFEFHMEGSKWVKVDSLNDHMFFLAPNYSRSFMAGDSSCGYSGGCIYFINMHVKGCPSSSGVFCVEDGSTLPIILHRETPSLCRPFWFLVNGWDNESSKCLLD